MEIKTDELKQRYQQLQKEIKEVAENSGRNSENIKLIAVSKNHPLEKIKLLQQEGVEVFAENRAQELRDKEEKADFNINWHFVGHLQRNKVKYLLRMDNCTMIHSLDSLRLAKEINKRAKKNNRIMPVLIQVNVAGDENKYGFKVNELLPFLEKTYNQFEYLRYKGLMTLVPYVEDPEEVRPYFKKLRELKEKAQEKGYNLPELSMGMSNDFKVAIEEGATMIRIGTALFGPRQY